MALEVGIGTGATVARPAPAVRLRGSQRNAGAGERNPVGAAPGSALSHAQRPFLTPFAPQLTVRLLARLGAHPAKAGVAKPRILASPRATDPTLRGTTTIAELL